MIYHWDAIVGRSRIPSNLERLNNVHADFGLAVIGGVLLVWKAIGLQNQRRWIESRSDPGRERLKAGAVPKASDGCALYGSRVVDAALVLTNLQTEPSVIFTVGSLAAFF